MQHWHDYHITIWYFIIFNYLEIMYVILDTFNAINPEVSKHSIKLQF